MVIYKDGDSWERESAANLPNRNQVEATIRRLRRPAHSSASLLDTASYHFLPSSGMAATAMRGCQHINQKANLIQLLKGCAAHYQVLRQGVNLYWIKPLRLCIKWKPDHSRCSWRWLLSNHLQTSSLANDGLVKLQDTFTTQQLQQQMISVNGEDGPDWHVHAIDGGKSK